MTTLSSLNCLLIVWTIAIYNHIAPVTGRMLWECIPLTGVCEECEVLPNSGTCTQNKLFGSQQSCSSECKVDPALARQMGLQRYYCRRGQCMACNVGLGQCPPNQPLYDGTSNCREHCFSVGQPITEEKEEPEHQCTRNGACSACSRNAGTCLQGLLVYRDKQTCTNACTSSSTKSCGPNEVFSQCSGCELQCSTVATSGPLRCFPNQCTTSGCVCREGYARDDREPRRLCVDPRQCSVPTSVFSTEKRFFCSTSVGACMDCGGNSERPICPSQFRMYPVQQTCEKDCRDFAAESSARYYQCFSDGECHSCEESLGNCVVGVQKYDSGGSCIAACKPPRRWECNNRGGCKQCALGVSCSSKGQDSFLTKELCQSSGCSRKTGSDSGWECAVNGVCQRCTENRCTRNGGVGFDSKAECKASGCATKFVSAFLRNFAWRCVNNIACIPCTERTCGTVFYLSKSLCEVDGCGRQTNVVNPSTLPGSASPGGAGGSSCIPNETHIRCLEWSLKGECEANAIWMKVHCQRSCNSCGVTIINGSLVTRSSNRQRTNSG